MKKQEKINKSLGQLVVTFQLMTALTDLLIADSNLLLYFSESKLYCSTHLPEFVVIYVCGLLRKSKVF